MIHSDIFSLIDLCKTSIQPIQLFIATPVEFIRNAIQYSFKKYCQNLGLSLSTVQLENGYVDQAGLFSEKRGTIFCTSSSLKSKKKIISLDAIIEIMKYQNGPFLFLLPEVVEFSLDRDFPSLHIFMLPDQKPWNVKKIIDKWCLKYAHSFQIELENPLVDQLIETHTPPCFLAIQNALDLLITHSSQSKKATIQDLRSLGYVDQKADFFDLLDNLLLGEKNFIFRDIMLLSKESSFQVIPVLRFLQSQIRNLIAILFQRKSLPYKSVTLEKRLTMAKKVGIFLLEEWIQRMMQYEVSVRMGSLSLDDSNHSFLLFCLSLLPSIESDRY